MVVVGALITGSFFAASQEDAMGKSARYSDAAMYIAEYGMNKVLADSPRTFFDNLTNATVQLTPLQVRDNNNVLIGIDSVWARRVGGMQFIVSKGVPTRGDAGVIAGSSRVLGVVVRTFNVAFPSDRAMQIYGGLVAKGSSLISGRDTFPMGTGHPQWANCPPPTGLNASVVAPDTTQITAQGSARYVGAKIQQPMDSTSFLKYGDVDYAMLVGFATKTYAGGAHPSPAPVANANGTCNTAVMDNWGEPGVPGGGSGLVAGCYSFFPIIHVTGNLQITAHGRGQGILLVDGNLDISGGFEFWGVTIVKGNLTSSGTGGHLNGTVMTMNSSNLNYDDVAVGNSVVELSTCAVQRAAANIPGFNRALPVSRHSWFDFTGAGAGF